MAANGMPSKPPPTLPPNQTLYCKNLPDKMNKNDLRRELYMLFSTHGTVLDVVALKTSKMKGQAHVVFRDIQTSSQAMRSLQGYDFFGKEMRISYGKGKSDMISRLDGSARMTDLKSQQQQQQQQAQQAQNAATDLQRSVFGGPPGTTGNAAAIQKQSPAGLPAQPPPPGAAVGLTAPNGATEEAARSPSIGTKRPREDESDEEGSPMEEDDEEDAMEESDSD